MHISRKLGATILLLASSCAGSPKLRTATVETSRAQALIEQCRASGSSAEACIASCEAAFPNGDSKVSSCEVTVDGNTTTLVAWLSEQGGDGALGCAEGRRPVGLRDEVRGPHAAGYLAWCAQMEAASVIAFERLAVHLARDGASPDLLARIEAARADEARHALAATELAHRFGAHVPGPTIDDEPAMTLLDRAIDNAVEGCVGETVAALRATMLAEVARDPQVRQVYQTIARDELRHAELAFELHAFYAARLSEHELTVVAAAHERAVVRALAAPHHPGLRDLGLAAEPLAAAVAALLAHRDAQLAA